MKFRAGPERGLVGCTRWGWDIYLRVRGAESIEARESGAARVKCRGGRSWLLVQRLLP